MAAITVRIVAPHFVAGLVYDDCANKVVEAAPILKYMLNWNRVMVKRYCGWKKWKASIVQ